ncbi:MAG: D-aminoacyl-tRNA deacylase [Pseudomonadota bacterium]
MKALLQRVSNAHVEVKNQCVAHIENGLLIFLGVEKEDTELDAQHLADRILHYRIFADDLGKMNLNIQQSNKSILVVSQFTLAADTKKGLRPGFQTAAAPLIAETLYRFFIKALQQPNIKVECGVFGADMQVSLTNDGPVTFLLSSR